MKKVKFSLIAMSTLLVIGCGGGGSKGESPREIMSKKDAVIIFYSYPQEICESSSFQERLRRKYPKSNVLFQVESNDVSCRTYGKRYPMCETSDSTDLGDKSCVVGFDFNSKHYKQDKIFVAQENIFTDMAILLDEVHAQVLD